MGQAVPREWSTKSEAQGVNAILAKSCASESDCQLARIAITLIDWTPVIGIQGVHLACPGQPRRALEFMKEESQNKTPQTRFESWDAS